MYLCSIYTNPLNRPLLDVTRIHSFHCMKEQKFILKCYSKPKIAYFYDSIRPLILKLNEYEKALHAYAVVIWPQFWGDGPAGYHHQGTGQK